MLKKTLISAVVLMLVTATMSFAALSTSTVLPGTSETFKYNLSSNCTCLYETDTNNVLYAMACKHKSGTRVFAVTNATSKVYYKEVNTTAYIGLDMTSSGAPATDVGGISAGSTDETLSGSSVGFKPL
jgi:uncharacterized protein YpuA (DUF1002 family)